MRFKWTLGRQKTGYDKMLLAQRRWLIRCDCYLIGYPVGAAIAPHTDKVFIGK